MDNDRLMSQITGIRLKNFKSWSDTGDLELAPVTGFFGANSSGKTSILQSLLLIKQTAASSDRSRALDLNGPFVELGTPGDVLHADATESQIQLQVRWHDDEGIQVVDPAAAPSAKPLRAGADLALSSIVSIDDKAVMSVTRLAYSVDGASFVIERPEGSNKYELRSDDYTFVRALGRPWPVPAPPKFYSFPDQVRGYYQNAAFLGDFEQSFEQVCSRIQYLGPLRQPPEREYKSGGSAPTGVGLKGENAIEQLIVATAAGRKISRGRSNNGARQLPGKPVERVVAEWLKELGLIATFHVEALDARKTIFHVEVQKTPEAKRVMLTDVGFGVSQILPVLILLASARSGETVVLEQPEIHLHPAVQSRLADVILETALARRVQVVFESHSEHLLTRMQRRVAEGDFMNGLHVSPESVAFYFCEFERGASAITRLKVNELGGIENWPKDFFGDPMADPVATARAATRKRA